MPKPTCHIVLVSQDSQWSKQACNGLNAAARALDNPLGIRFLTALDAGQAMRMVYTDGDLQPVLVDSTLAASQDCPDARALLRQVRQTRPELDIYLLVQGTRDEAQLAHWLHEPLTACFHQHKCYREAGASTAMTEAQLRSEYDHEVARAGESNTACAGLAF